MEPTGKCVLLGKHQTCTQNMESSPEKQHRGVNIFQTEGKRDTCYHEILTEDNMFKKDLLFHRNWWNFLSIFQQNSLPWQCLAQRGVQKQEWLDEALKSVPLHLPVGSGHSPDPVQSSGWLYVGLWALILFCRAKAAWHVSGVTPWYPIQKTDWFLLIRIILPLSPLTFPH